MASKLMPSEWAIQEARRFTEKWKLIRFTLPIARLLDAVRDECRREWLEEAAKIAMNGSEHKCGSLWCNDGAAHARGDVAAEIRALIDKEPRA